MARLPRLLDDRDLPYAELNAARLDGELYEIDECFAPIDEPETKWLRAFSLALRYPEAVIMGESALWVFVGHAAPSIHHSMRHRLRGRLPLVGRMYTHEGRVPAPDCTVVAGIAMTTPVRTAIDLARAGFDEEQVRRLLEDNSLTVGDCLADLERRPRFMGGSKAKDYFEKLSHPALTRYAS